jgi:hypothetical protein
MLFLSVVSLTGCFDIIKGKEVCAKSDNTGKPVLTPNADKGIRHSLMKRKTSLVACCCSPRLLPLLLLCCCYRCCTLV